MGWGGGREPKRKRKKNHTTDQSWEQRDGKGASQEGSWGWGAETPTPDQECSTLTKAVRVSRGDRGHFIFFPSFFLFLKQKTKTKRQEMLTPQGPGQAGVG